MASSGMQGRVLGHYRILEQIGAGGMGVVFRARDERLQREVAVKVLPAGTLADNTTRGRFRSEALALSALNHPNIAIVHDFDTQDGVDFLVTEYIPGETLDAKVASGPLSEKEVIQLGSQMAEGLAAAQAQAIVHRDLKPGNLRVTPDGRLKILDFGLARLQPAADAETVTAPETRTVAGTVPYMSPEQLRGESLDGRSDIWSAGVVLYELACGRLPFQAKTATALAGDILHVPPPSPRQVRATLSQRLEDIIIKCLEKDPDNRYQTAKELLVDFRRMASTSSATCATAQAARRRKGGAWWAIAALAALAVFALLAAAGYLFLRRPAIRSVAVLPFVNSTGDAGKEFIADGVTEELINGLTQVAGVKVIARPTAFTYRGRQVRPQQAGKELGVAAIVLGRLAVSAGQVSIQVDIVDTADGSEIWGGQFSQRVSEMQSLQRQIAVRVSDELRLKVSGDQARRLGRQTTRDPEAYQLYLRGRFCLSEVNAIKFPQCIAWFQQAVDKDSSYAQAWAGLADANAYLGLFDLQPPAQVVARAREAATRAIEIDEGQSEAHTSLGIIKLCFDWDLQGAEAEFRRAVQLNPGDVFSRHFYAHYLEVAGNMDLANEEMRKIVELDPLSTMYNSDLAWEYYAMGQPQRVIELASRWKNADSTDSTWWMTLAGAYEQQRNSDQCVELAEQVLARDDTPVIRGQAAAYLARHGRRDQALRVLTQLRERARTSYVPPFALATLCFALGQQDDAFEYLRQAFEQHSASIVFNWVYDPQFDSYRRNPRSIELARRYGFPVNAGPRKL